MATDMVTDTATATMRSDADRVRPPLTQAPASILAGVLVVASAAAPQVFATSWKTNVDDSIEARIVFVDRTGSDEASGPVLQLRPGVSIQRQGARASADIRYRLNVSVGGSDTDPETFTHDLIARGNVEAIERVLFFDMSAGARYVGNSATAGVVDPITGRTDGQQSYSLRVSPIIRPETDNRYVRFVSNNTLDLVNYTGGSGNNNDGSNSATWNLALESGPYFTTFPWDVGVTETTTDFQDRDDTRREYTAGGAYLISPRWRLTGRVGYEENDVDTSRTDTDGATWNVGGGWTPNPRTSLVVDYGDRYFGETYSGRFTHRSRRTTFSLDASRDITNRRNSRLVDEFFLLVDQNGNPIVDPISGQPIFVNIPQLEETDEDFLNTQLRGAISVTGLRTNVSLTGSVANRKFEVSGDEEDVYRVGLSASRRLGQGISATLFGNADRAEGTTNGDSDSYDVGLRLSKSLSTRTSVSLDLLHRKREGDVAADDFEENRIGLTLSTSFLD